MSLLGNLFAGLVVKPLTKLVTYAFRQKDGTVKGTEEAQEVAPAVAAIGQAAAQEAGDSISQTVAAHSGNLAALAEAVNSSPEK